MWNTMSCTRDRKVIFGITIFCLAISLSKNASIDTLTKNDDANEKIKKLLKEDDDGVVVQTTTVYPAQEIKKNEEIIGKESLTIDNSNKKPSISVSGIDDDGKKTDAVLKTDTNNNNTSDTASDEKKLHSETDQRQPATKANSEAETEVENVKKNVTETVEEAFLPAEGAAEQEHSSSLAIFFVLFVLVLCIFLIHFILQNKCHYIPESLAIVFLGAFIGAVIKILPDEDLKKLESFSPTAFFLVLLPPIIFESGYNLHKGNFFANLGSILLFAIVGTLISALVVGGGCYILGLADLVYPLNFVESFAFGSLISAVDPVATLAIFQALDVDPVLNMLVFGESILNDAVAIVLTSTIVQSSSPEMAHMTSSEQVLMSVQRFIVTFLGSAGIGILFGLVSSLVLKHVDLYYNPSLEFALMLCFVYIPYAFAEGIHLSGIMAILFCGIVMSQYTHYNLSPVTQITMQQTMRTLAFACESCVFAYLGLAIFSFPHKLELSLIIWSILFILIGRALNIFPLSYVCNRFRSHQISKRMMVIMWFSGLRGAIAYALSLHLEFKEETRKVLVTTTLVVVLFTTIILGGGTMPLMKYLERSQRSAPRRSRRRRKKEITMSKTREMGTTIESEHLSELTCTEEELENTSFNIGNKKVGFLYWDLKYIRPFFTRRFTQRELKEGKSHITELTDKWFKEINRDDEPGEHLLLSDSEEEFNQNQD